MKQSHPTADDKMDDWFMENIVKPTMKTWGPGWPLISDEMAMNAIQSACFRNLLIQHSCDKVKTDPESAAALGRHVIAIRDAFYRWSEGHE